MKKDARTLVAEPVAAAASKVVVATVSSPRKYYVGVGEDLCASPARALRFIKGAESTRHILETLSKVYSEDALQLTDDIVEA